MIPLSDMKPGDTGLIHQIIGHDHICQRLMEMGILEGEQVEFVTVAPLGDPIEIRVSGYLLSLRRNEAARVIVQ